MSSCNSSKQFRIISQQATPFCDVISVAHLISLVLNIPIDIKKFIKCLSSDDSDKKYRHKFWMQLKEKDLLKYILCVKLDKLKQNCKEGNPIYVSIDYEALCDPNRILEFLPEDTQDIIDGYNNKNYNECYKCGLSVHLGLVIAANIKERTRSKVPSICKGICRDSGLVYTLPIKHQLWLSSIHYELYDPDNIPVYDYNSPIDSSDSKNYSINIFEISKKSSSEIKNHQPSIFTCSENHNLETDDYIVLTNYDQVSLPWPLGLFYVRADELVLRVLEIKSPTEFIAKIGAADQFTVYKEDHISCFAENAKQFNQQIFKFKKIEGRHRVILVDCEENNDDTHTFTIINSWGLSKSYKTKFKVDNSFNIGRNILDASLIDEDLYGFRLLKKSIYNSNIGPDGEIFDKGLNKIHIAILPKSDKNWNQFLPITKLKDPCGFCKYCCDEIFGYSPPTNIIIEDKTEKYNNINCSQLGYHKLSYNPIRPHLCECVCEDFFYHNGTECVPIEGAWCVIQECEGQFYVTGCQEGTMLEWAAQNALTKAGNFNRGGTCSTNPFSDIDCEIETLPENCLSLSSSSSSAANLSSSSSSSSISFSPVYACGFGSPEANGQYIHNGLFFNDNPIYTNYFSTLYKALPIDTWAISLSDGVAGTVAYYSFNPNSVIDNYWTWSGLDGIESDGVTQSIPCSNP